MTAPLDGVRILDLSRLLPGPAATWYLQGLGAAVDRVEQPGRGDFTRSIPPYVDGVGAWFAAVSRGKRSVGIDLHNDAGRALVGRLLGHYDVLVEGFKPGVLEAMGLHPERLLADHPGLVIARISGFGQTGPLVDAPGHDINYLGYAGAIAGTAHGPRGPVSSSVQIADFSAAMIAAMGIAAGLFERERQRAAGGAPTGRVLDVSLTEAALAMLGPHLVAATAAGVDPEPGGGILCGGSPIYGCYRCSDGLWITVGALEPRFQERLVAGTGSLERADLARVFATKPRDAWVELLQQACVGPSLALTELPDHPLFAERRVIERAAAASWVLPPLAEPGQISGAVPGLGAHTDAVLEACGVTLEERAALRSQGAIT